MRLALEQCGAGRGRWTRAALAAMVFGMVLSACSAYHAHEPFDSTSFLRGQYEERVGKSEAAQLLVPFELDESIRAVAAEVIPTSGSDRWRVQTVLDLIFGRLELEYSLTPTRSAVDTFEQRQANCLSFVNLFVGLARERRLSPFYVEVRDQHRWSYRQGTVISHGHIVAGLYIDGKLSTFDFLPYRPKSYRDFEPIDDLRAAAHFYNNLGAEALMAGQLERAGELLKVAVGLAPDFSKAANNLGVYHLRRGETEKAAEIYRLGLEATPDDVALLSNMARAHQDLGQLDQAQEILTGLEGLHHSNPYFYVYRGEIALAQGEHEVALEYMRNALRRDSEVPEVHLGLAKVYLAIGEASKARHHVSRALRLDATHQEARLFAAMLERSYPAESHQ